MTWFFLKGVCVSTEESSSGQRLLAVHHHWILLIRTNGRTWFLLGKHIWMNEIFIRNFSTSSLCLWWPGCCRLLSWSLVTLSSSSSFSEGFVSESWIEKHSKYILDLSKVVNYQPLLTMIFSSQLCPELRCRRSGEYLMNLIKIKYLFRITGVLVVGFIICWTPYNVMSLWWVTKHNFRHVYLIEGGG